MEVIVPLLRLPLAGVFLLAGATKMRDRAGSARTLIDFGVPAPFASPLALALPAAELATAALLLPAASARVGAYAAITLLLIFVAGIVASLVRGRRPRCRCFGELHAQPIGARVLIRNSVLLLAAIVVAAAGPDGGGSLFAWLAPLDTFQRAILGGLSAAVALLVAQTVLLARLLRERSAAAGSIDSVSAEPPAVPGMDTAPAPVPPPPLPAGSPAPEFTATDLDGNPVALSALRSRGRQVALVFTDPACAPCNELWADFTRWQREISSLTLVVIGRGDRQVYVDKCREQPLADVLMQRDWEIASAYRVIGTPGAVIVNADGTIGAPAVQGDAAVRQLISSHADPAAAIGAPAPALALSDLDGAQVSLADYRGRETLVLFWNPACGFCQRMLADLQRWEREPLAARAQLLVVSTGDVETNRALGLHSTVVLDPELKTMSAWGARGTPSGILVDAGGRRASAVLTGAAAIFAYLGFTPSETAAPPRLHDGARPAKQSCVHDELLADGTIVLYNGCRQEVLTLNATGALVWESCDGSRGIDDIVADVRDVFPQAADVHRDVRALLDQLLAAGMIDPDGAPASPAEAVATV